MINRFYELERFFFESISLKYINLDEHNTAYATGVNSFNLNPVMMRHCPENLEVFLQHCDSLYSTYNLEWILGVSDKAFQELHDNLGNYGLEQLEKTVAMSLDLNLLKLQSPSRILDIRSTDGQLEDWIFPLKDAFDSTSQVAEQYKNAHKVNLSQNKAFQHFTGYLDNQPICSLTLSMKGESARIDDFGTHPFYQKKGYGTELLEFALKKAREKKVRYCFLESSATGLKLYKKFGFMPIFKNKLFKKSNLEILPI